MYADSKSRAQELSNDVSFVIFGHQTWDLEGGVKLTPPQHILVFKYPSRDRVKSHKTGLLKSKGRHKTGLLMSKGRHKTGFLKSKGRHKIYLIKSKGRRKNLFIINIIISLNVLSIFKCNFFVGKKEFSFIIDFCEDGFVLFV